MSCMPSCIRSKKSRELSKLKKLQKIDKVVISEKNQQPEKLQDQLHPLLFLRDTNIEKQIQNSWKMNDETKLNWIRENTIGICNRYISGLGIQVQNVYIDHTATNRSFRPIQQMVEYAKGFIGNPHTQYSYCGKFGTELMHDSHNKLLKNFNASPQDYVALPAGNGCTGAIEKAIKILQSNKKLQNPEIFLSPYEHHSNILPWIQFYGSPTLLKHQQKNGRLDIDQCQRQIQESQRQSILVSISASSNITSQKTELQKFNQIIKTLRRNLRNKTIVFAVDCAAFCSHNHLNLQQLNQIDLAYISPHKNLGGTQSCGILLSRKSLINYSTPTMPGGGTVNLVYGYDKDKILYSNNPFEKQISGTPPFLGYYRAALSFELLTQLITYKLIKKQERRNTQYFFKKILKVNQRIKSSGINKYIRIYGDDKLDNRGNVITFSIYDSQKRLNYDIASLILSDIFGIQVRSGCFCAGPYGMLIDTQTSWVEEDIKTVVSQIQEGNVTNKPGYIRLDMPFYFQKYQIKYVIQAIEMLTIHWDTYSQFYIVDEKGSVHRSPVFGKQSQINFSLKKSRQIEKVLKSKEEKNREQIIQRQMILEFQLQRAQYIAKETEWFLQKVKKGEYFQIQKR